MIPEVAQVLRSGGDGGVPSSRPGNAWAEENAYIAFPINTQVALRHKKLGERTGLGIGEDGDPSYTLGANHSHAVAHSPCTDPGDPTPTLRSMSHSSSHQNGGGHSAVIVSNLVVRRLTPLECSRLQGFLDDYLKQVSWKKRETPPDGLMYRALGNSMAVPVIEWIGKKIMEAVAYKESDES